MNRAISPRDKPFLDEETFQRILAAAYALQKQKIYQQPRKVETNYPEPVSFKAAVSRQTVPGETCVISPKEPEKNFYCAPAEQGTLETTQPELMPANQSVTQAASRKPVRVLDRLFWTVAAFAAIAAILFLSFMADVHRTSPLSAALSPAPENAQQPAPFQRTSLELKSPASSPVIAIEKATNKTTAPQKITRVAAAKLSTSKHSVRRHIHHRVQSREDDIVAKDTVIYYGASPATSASSRH